MEDSLKFAVDACEQAAREMNKLSEKLDAAPEDQRLLLGYISAFAKLEYASALMQIAQVQELQLILNVLRR